MVHGGVPTPPHPTPPHPTPPHPTPPHRSKKVAAIQTYFLLSGVLFHRCASHVVGPVDVASLPLSPGCFQSLAPDRSCCLGASEYLRTGVGLCIPPMCLLDYKGFRMLAQVCHVFRTAASLNAAVQDRTPEFCAVYYTILEAAEFSNAVRVSY